VRLDELKAMLNITVPNCAEMDLQVSRKSLIDTFPIDPASIEINHLSTRHPSLRYQQMSQTLLYEQSVYKDWLASPTSSLLYLTGITSPEACIKRPTTYSWLSPAAIYVAEQQSASEKSDDLCVYYNCHPSLSPDANVRHGSLELLGSIIWSVLRWKPAVLRHRWQHVKQGIEKAKSLRAEGDIRQSVKSMINLLKDVLIEAQKRTDNGFAYFVLDRLDQIDIKLRYLMDELAHIVAVRDCKVKMFVVVDPAYAQGEWDLDMLDSEFRDRVLHQANWDQTRLPTYERIWNNAKKLGMDNGVDVADTKE